MLLSHLQQLGKSRRSAAALVLPIPLEPFGKHFALPWSCVYWLALKRYACCSSKGHRRQSRTGSAGVEMLNGIWGHHRPAVPCSSHLPTLRKASPLPCICRCISCDSRVVDAGGASSGLGMGGVGAWACCLSGLGVERRHAGKYVLQLQFRASTSPCVCPGCVLTG